MTIILEISRPPQWRPWRYASPLMWRCGWTWIAVACLRVPFRAFCETPQQWEAEGELGL